MLSACMAHVSQGLDLYMELSGWLSGKDPAYQCRRRGFEPWVQKIPWRRKWESTPIFLPGKSQGQETGGYSPWGCRVGHARARVSITYYLYIGALQDLTERCDRTGRSAKASGEAEYKPSLAWPGRLLVQRRMGGAITGSEGDEAGRQCGWDTEGQQCEQRLWGLSKAPGQWRGPPSSWAEGARCEDDQPGDGRQTGCRNSARVRRANDRCQRQSRVEGIRA